MSEYVHKVYATGFAIKVTPEDRGVDVMHNIITGGLLGGRSLEGVTAEEVEHSDAAKRSANAFRRDMQETKKANQ